MTYNANGGYFDSTSSTTTKEEKVPAQPSYRLNTTDEFKPTRDQVDGKNVAFVGWSLDKKDTIYGLDDSYDDSILAATVDVSSEDKTVYAVWGYDTNGDGKPDVQDESYGITASVDGGNGSITPPTRYVLAGANAEFTIKPRKTTPWTPSKLRRGIFLITRQKLKPTPTTGSTTSPGMPAEPSP